MIDIDYWDYIEKIGPMEAKQFKRAHAKLRTKFEENIRPCLFDGETYYPLSSIKHMPGRNHLPTQAVVNDGSHLLENSFFANRLTVAELESDGQNPPSYPSPSSRVVLGGLQFYTFEFDVPDIEFLRTQLSWLRGGKKPTDCRMGKLFSECSRWTDFKGITVCWSGNKSLHIHVAFDTDQYVARFPTNSEHVREGLKRQWDLLKPLIIECLGLSGSTHNPDPQLCQPEQYRRLPNGLREIESDNHILGIPRGTIVQQVTLWEMWRDRAAKRSTGLFHSPTSFAAPPRRQERTHASQPGTSEGTDTFTSAEIAYCALRLKEFFPDDCYPKLEAIHQETGRWTARFYNSPEDRNPASIMREEYSNIRFMGRDAANLSAATLPKPLGEMMGQWVVEFNAPSGNTTFVDGPEREPVCEFERQFSLATNHNEARVVLDQHLPMSVLRNPLLLVKAPEGATKTSVLLKHHPRIATNLRNADNSNSHAPRRTMYAFGNYHESEQKCAAFNAEHIGSDYHGIVLPSFSRNYEEACEELRHDKLTIERAAQKGFRSLWSAIEAYQPDVVQYLKARYMRIWEEVGERQPVFFTVHQVAQVWNRGTLSRQMATPSYWHLEPRERHGICLAETRLALLVYDEVQRSTFAEAIKGETHDWIDGLQTSLDTPWLESSLREREEAFRQFQTVRPNPLIDFHLANALPHMTFEPSVVTQDTGEYSTSFGERDFYAARHGRKWHISTKNWWKELDAQRIVFLTTEEVPTAIAQKADAGIRIFHLDADSLPRDTIRVHGSRFVTSGRMQECVQNWRSKRGEDWFAISNKLGGAEGTLTHARAKGSNELLGKKIIQTCGFMSPDEYEELQAFNAWTGRDDLVLLRHVDELNQSAGRNLGFRYREGAEHALLTNINLFGLIAPKLGYCRYDLEVHESAERRREFIRRGERRKLESDECINDERETKVLPFKHSISAEKSLNPVAAQLAVTALASRHRHVDEGRGSRAG